MFGGGFGRDPFAEFGGMNDDPFGGRGPGNQLATRGPGGGGRELAPRGHPGQARNPFEAMDQMMDQMMGGFGGPMMRGGGGMRGGGMGGMGDMMAQMQQQGGGQFSSQVMVMSSSMGQDGKMHTERFVESSVNNGRGASERQQAYSNSRTGMDKMGLERNLHDRGRKVVKERNRGTGEERQTALFRGMEESHAEQFDRDWHQQAGNLRHPQFASMLGAGTQGMIQGGHPGQMGGRPGPRGIEDRRFR